MNFAQFQSVLQGWHDFYIVGATSAATLIGLLFVGLSLHLAIVLSRSEVRALARVTMTNFVIILLLSLFVIIPQNASSLASELIVSGGVSLAVVTPSLVQASRSGTRTLALRRLVLRFGLSVIAYAGVVVAGVLTTSVDVHIALSSLVGVTVALLIVSLRNSWDLLVDVGKATMDTPK